MGKFRIRIDRIINLREIRMKNTIYSFNMKIKFEGKFVVNTLLFFSDMNIVFQIFPPKLTDCKRFYFVGKFRIRNERIIDSRELDINDMSYLSHMEIRFEVNLLQILCPVKITNISLIKKFPQKCCPGGRSAPPAPTWLCHWSISRL